MSDLFEVYLKAELRCEKRVWTVGSDERHISGAQLWIEGALDQTYCLEKQEKFFLKEVRVHQHKLRTFE